MVYTTNKGNETWTLIKEKMRSLRWLTVFAGGSTVEEVVDTEG